MSIYRPPRLLLLGGLLFLGLGSVSCLSAVAQSGPDRSAPRSSSPNDLPAWAEPRASPPDTEHRSSAPPSRKEKMRTKGNPGFPGGDPEQEVPIGGGGGAALLAAAGAAYGIRRLGDNDDPDGAPPSD